MDQQNSAQSVILENEKAILLSVKPQFANCLVDGVKTIELRKSFPQGLASGTKMYIYSSSPQQKIIGDCEIVSVERLPIDSLWKRAICEAMISWEEFVAYFDGKADGVAITLQKPRRYTDPISLRKFTSDNVVSPPQSFQYINAPRTLME